jgi:hypothetical protein
MLGCGPAVRSDAMPEDERVRNFKEQIGFDKIGSGKEAGGGIVAAPWPDCLGLLGLEGKGWRAGRDSIFELIRPGVASRSCLLEKGKRVIEVEIFVSSAGPEAGRKRLVDLAAATMFPTVPYRLDPQGPGDLAVRHANTKVPDRIWAFRNVCFRVREHSYTMDVSPFPGEIQRFAEKHVVPGAPDTSPRIRRVDVSTKRVRVGETFVVKIEMEPGADAKDLLFDYRDHAGLLTRVKMGAGSWIFRGESPGLAKLDVMAADRHTLLSAGATVQVEIVAAEGER